MSIFRSIARAITPEPVKALYRQHRPSPFVLPEKLHLIDAALALGARRFADLGGMWRVNGAYTFHAADHGADSVVMVDTHETNEFIASRRQRSNVTFRKGNFARASVAAALGPLDAVLLYDVLLHQVNPDWHDVLATYAQHARLLLVYNQQYTGPTTVRLIDKGEAWYRRHAPVTDSEAYRNFFTRPTEIDPRYDDQRPHRDICDVWQWGITDTDLLRVMSDLGYTVEYDKDCGWRAPMEEIKDRAFLFRRQD